MRHLYALLLIFHIFALSAQEEKVRPFDLEADLFYGTILEHNPDISHLITEHPTGLMLAYNRKTYGFEEWERRYNFPDVGYTFAYQDMKNFHLGEVYSGYAHYNFYYWKRRLQFRIGQGIAVATKPYDRETNFINNAYGTRVMSSTMLKFGYKQNNIWKGFGLHAGVSIIHYSNANLRAPNNSTNTWAFTAGINYFPDYEKMPDYIPMGEKTKYSEPLHYNVVARSGVNQSDINNSGRYGFLHLTGFVDKRINHKSTLVGGVDVFFSNFLKELIRYESIALPDSGVTGDEDWKRAGIYVGHELHFDEMSFVSELGYYVYYPFDFEGRFYNRLGLKRTFGDHLFGVVTVRAHGAKAEEVEFGVGWRF
ncbi:acyloxyacyl hydrolase [Dokdonia sinensis]|uniref:Acyloxyacyl hydrolase n=1 Tax=Dokdonia sinensis TaxID=2479847 RepID=A0A3M0GED2_9FLAO|nr:acyloxyacyl hydrolase [Dokdonia sinensis]RMB62847.1 acyloxyacyl hydrolase [Dokdonia sinensis]